MKNSIIKTFKQNNIFLKNLLSSLKNEDMLLSTGDSNTIGWILGHMVIQRGQILKTFDREFEIPEKENIFQRGAVKNKNVEVALDEELKLFMDRGDKIVNEIDRVGEEGLLEKMPVKLPFGGDDVVSLLHFLAWHETFHIGQIDLIKAATGKGGTK